MEELGPRSVAGLVKVFAGAIPAALEAVREERSWLSPLSDNSWCSRKALGERHSLETSAGGPEVSALAA